MHFVFVYYLCCTLVHLLSFVLFIHNSIDTHLLFYWTLSLAFVGKMVMCWRTVITRGVKWVWCARRQVACLSHLLFTHYPSWQDDRWWADSVGFWWWCITQNYWFSSSLGYWTMDKVQNLSNSQRWWSLYGLFNNLVVTKWESKVKTSEEKADNVVVMSLHHLLTFCQLYLCS
jgi:hypothetical protein